MSFLPISNPQTSTEKATRIAIIGNDQVKTVFVKSLNITDRNFILPLHVTSFKSTLIEWVEIPSNSPLDIIITLLKNVSGLIYATNSNDYTLLDSILSQKSLKVLLVKSCPLGVGPQFPEILLDTIDTADKSILHNFLDSLI
jgi:hypothetical protein